MHGVLDGLAADYPRDPLYQGAGWWLVTADVSAPPPAAVTAVAAESGGPCLLLSLGRDVGTWQVDLWAGSGRLTLVVPREQTSADLADWVRAHHPGKRASSEVLWRDRDARQQAAAHRVDDLSASWLARHGWRLHRGYDTARMLGGCLADAVGLQHRNVGETRVPWSAVRWATGYGEGFYGLWDRDAPDQPVMTWPRDAAGHRAVGAEQFRRVQAPLLAGTRLDGARWWAPTHNDQDPSGRMMVHLSAPPRRMSIVVATDPPVTTVLSRPGRMTLYRQQAQGMGLPVPDNANMIEVPLRDARQACTIAEAVFSSSSIQSWRHVPDNVPRAFLATVEWVRAQPKR